MENFILLKKKKKKLILLNNIKIFHKVKKILIISFIIKPYVLRYKIYILKKQLL